MKAGVEPWDRPRLRSLTPRPSPRGGGDPRATIETRLARRVARAAEDPLTIAAVGDLGVRLSGAEALVERAALRVDEAGRAPDERSRAGASIAVAEARVATTQAALAVANKLFELAGSRATLAELGLDRRWRDARTHTLHWKYHAIGNYLLNGVAPPRHGAI